MTTAPLTIRFDYDKAARLPPGTGYDARPLLSTIRGIVLHSTEHLTGQPFSGVCTFLRDSPKVSAHYVVDLDGTVQRVLDPAWRAWHAGESLWHGVPELNDWTIGIEVYHQEGGTGYTTAQLAATAALIRLLMHERPAILPANLVAHRWVAVGGEDARTGRPLGPTETGRKIDPSNWSDPGLRAWFASL